MDDWIKVEDSMPSGNWTVATDRYSEEVIVANSCAVVIAHYDRKLGQWQTGSPKDHLWIDKITHWMPKPRNPHLV